MYELSEFFSSDKLYKYVGTITLLTLYGTIRGGEEHVLRGKDWIQLLVFDMSPNSMPPLEELFEEV